MKDDVLVQIKKVSTFLCDKFSIKYGPLVELDDLRSYMFTKYLEHEEQGEQVGDLFAFLYKTARTLYVRELRRLHKRASRELSRLIRQSRSMESKADMQKKMSAVFKAYNGLSSYEKTVFNLAVLQDRGINPTAETVHRSPNKIRRDLRKILHEIKLLLF